MVRGPGRLARAPAAGPARLFSGGGLRARVGRLVAGGVSQVPGRCVGGAGFGWLCGWVRGSVGYVGVDGLNGLIHWMEGRTGARTDCHRPSYAQSIFIHPPISLHPSNHNPPPPKQRPQARPKDLPSQPFLMLNIPIPAQPATLEACLAEGVFADQVRCFVCFLWAVVDRWMDGWMTRPFAGIDRGLGSMHN